MSLVAKFLEDVSKSDRKHLESCFNVLAKSNNAEWSWSGVKNDEITFHDDSILSRAKANWNYFNYGEEMPDWHSKGPNWLFNLYCKEQEEDSIDNFGEDFLWMIRAKEFNERTNTFILRVK